MRKSSTIALLFFIFTTSAFADLTVVQEEEQVHPGGTNKLRQTVKIKKSKIRIDMDIPVYPTSVITDRASGWGATLIHKEKKYIEGSPAGTKEDYEMIVDRMREEGKIPEKRPELRPTGRKDLINGWNVEEYVVETEHLKASYWLAKELVSLNKYAALMKNPRLEEINRQFPDISKAPGFPILTILEPIYGGGMKLKTTIRVMSIKEQEIPDSEFKVPATYQKKEPGKR